MHADQWPHECDVVSRSGRSVVPSPEPGPTAPTVDSVDGRAEVGSGTPLRGATGSGGPADQRTARGCVAGSVVSASGQCRRSSTSRRGSVGHRARAVAQRTSPSDGRTVRSAGTGDGTGGSTECPERRECGDQCRPPFGTVLRSLGPSSSRRVGLPFASGEHYPDAEGLRNPFPEIARKMHSRTRDEAPGTDGAEGFFVGVARPRPVRRPVRRPRRRRPRCGPWRRPAWHRRPPAPRCGRRPRAG
jgi:hypothetical protein